MGAAGVEDVGVGASSPFVLVDAAAPWFAPFLLVGF